MQKEITKGQIKGIRAAIAAQGLPKDDVISGASAGRTTSTSELTFSEAYDLLKFLNKPEKKETNPSSRLMGKLFAMCHEMGWIEEKTVLVGGELKKKKDYVKVYKWVSTYGYLKKPLRDYSYKELPKLVSQLEIYVYNPYIVSLNKPQTHEKANNPCKSDTVNASSQRTNENPFL